MIPWLVPSAITNNCKSKLYPDKSPLWYVAFVSFKLLESSVCNMMWSYSSCNTMFMLMSFCGLEKWSKSQTLNKFPLKIQKQQTTKRCSLHFNHIYYIKTLFVHSFIIFTKGDEETRRWEFPWCKVRLRLLFSVLLHAKMSSRSCRS